MFNWLVITLINMSAKAKLARMVNPNRANLIKWFSYRFDGTSTQGIECLTKVAIEKGYVSPRKTPPGVSLKSWVMANNAPQWACRAAFDFLIDNQWKPEDEYSRAIAARYFLLNNYVITEEWNAILGVWLTIARQADNENN